MVRPMPNEHDHYLVEAAERLDLRYYRIRVDGKTYVVDYSNPADLRLFFPGLFPAETSRYRVWDESAGLGYRRKTRSQGTTDLMVGKIAVRRIPDRRHGHAYTAEHPSADG